MAIANLVVIALTGFFSYVGFVNPYFIRQYLFSTESILKNREYFRLITSGVLHADWTHLLFNMYSLYSFGSAIEFFFGPGNFLAIYLAGIVGGNLFALLIHRNQIYYALGASGGVCGVIFASIFLIPGSSVYILFIPVPIPAYLFAIGFILFSYFGMRKQIGNIGHDAHLGGSIIGLLTATALHPSIVTQNPVLYSAVMLLAVSLLVLLYISLGRRPNRQLKRESPDDE